MGIFARNSSDERAKVEAIMRSQAVIEFTLDGTIITANDNFLAALGYELAEVVGKHHRMFVDPQDADSPEYRQFWAELGAGKFQAAAYRRIAKGGREIWIQATYNPIFDKSGKPLKVIKFATDITAQKNQAADHEAQIAAISRVQAVIEFNLDGTIRQANENFLATVGYGMDEIAGKHHRMFCEPGYAASADYAQFWDRLRAGEYVAAEFQRFGKGGKEIWIQASYNPILDANGKPAKVIKFATDRAQAGGRHYRPPDHQPRQDGGGRPYRPDRHPFHRPVRAVAAGIQPVARSAVRHRQWPPEDVAVAQDRDQ